MYIRLNFLRKYSSYNARDYINLFENHCFITYVGMVDLKKNFRACQRRQSATSQKTTSGLSSSTQYPISNCRNSIFREYIASVDSLGQIPKLHRVMVEKPETGSGAKSVKMTQIGENECLKPKKCLFFIDHRL